MCEGKSEGHSESLLSYGVTDCSPASGTDGGIVRTLQVQMKGGREGSRTNLKRELKGSSPDGGETYNNHTGKMCEGGVQER